MYTKKYHNQKQNNREEELKKASRNKLLIPIENEDPVADPTTVREYDSSEEEFAVNDFDATDELIRSIHERTNQRHQDAVDAYANPFPLDYFPKKIREYLEDCERCLSTNIEYLAGGLLCAVSGAIGNKFNAELTRDKRNSGCLYMVIVGPTGANKTLPLQTVLKPLFVIEKELAKKYEQEKQNSDELLIENRCIVNDCTMEAILEILENNDVTVYHDEFYGFLSSFNKYRGGDDMEKWLSIWSAAQMRTDRKNKKGKLIEKPFANCIGTIQQDVLVDFLTKNNTNNGFNERLLFITTKKNDSAKWSNLEISPELEGHYINLVKRIYYTPASIDEEGNKTTKMLRFSDDALHCITEWQHSNADLCRNSNNSQLVAVYKKLEIYAIRFSLIMAIMDYATKGTSLLEKGNIKILPPHVKAAIGITEYFRGSAKKILSFKPNTKSLKNTNQRFIDFFEKLPPRFPTGQAREIGKELQLSERQVYYYLDSEYFKPIKRGFYKKNYKFV